jgi:hypothetical protein
MSVIQSQSILTNLQWVVINTVAGGGILYDAADGHLPLVVAIILILVV